MSPAASRGARSTSSGTPPCHFFSGDWVENLKSIPARKTRSKSNFGQSSLCVSQSASPAFPFLLLVLFVTVFHPASAQIPSAPAARFVVVIDAAHGGADRGGTIPEPDGGFSPTPEKSYTLALSVRLRSLLGARGISVVTTRESDIALDDQHRAEIADHAQAQACITLHASTSGSGVHLFLSSLPPARPARFMPWKTAQAAYVDRSIALAGVLNSALAHAGMKVTLGRTALTTIDSMTCPAVAVEISPESRPGGRTTALDDPGYEARIATALSAGLLEWRTEPR